jgi:DNA polymerase-3 subunit delta
MATASENKIREELQKKKLRDLYVLVGDDPYKLDFYADSVFKTAFEGGTAAKDIYYSDELDIPSLLDQVRTPSLWDPQKAILIRHGERLSAKSWEALLPLLQDPFERCVVVIQCAKADGRVKFFQALGKAEDRCVMVKLEPAFGGEWNLWLQSFLKEAEKDMDDAARELLREWTTGSLAELKHTVERAALFADAEEKIRQEHVRAVGFRITQDDVFQLTGAILSGSRAEALSVLEALMKQGEEPLALLGLISRQYRWLLSILAMRAEGKADQAIASAAGIYPNAAKVLFPASRRLGGKGVIRGLNALARTDFTLKSSRLPKEHVMTQLVLTLTE